MRQTFFAFFLLLLVCCKQKNKPETEAQKAETEALVVVDAYQKYVSYISSLDTTTAESVGRAATEFNELFKGADTSKADSGLLLFHNFYTLVEKNLNEALLRDTTDYTPYAASSTPYNGPKTLKGLAFADKLEKNGYVFDLTEGSAYIRRNYNFLPDHIYPNVSGTMKQYLEQVRKESDEGFMDDGGLVITPLDLTQRILFWENFSLAHPNFVYKNEIEAAQREKVTFLLEGLPNTPVIEYGSKSLSPAFKEAYDFVIANAPASNLALLVKPYYTALQQKNNKKVEAVLKDYRLKQVIFDFGAS